MFDKNTALPKSSFFFCYKSRSSKEVCSKKINKFYSSAKRKNVVACIIDKEFRKIYPKTKCFLPSVCSITCSTCHFCYQQISASWANQKVPYAGATKDIKKGVYIKGTINILGFAPSVEILLSDEVRTS